MKTNFKGISGFYRVFNFISGEVQILVVKSDQSFSGEQYFPPTKIKPGAFYPDKVTNM